MMFLLLMIHLFYLVFFCCFKDVFVLWWSFKGLILQKDIGYDTTINNVYDNLWKNTILDFL